MREAGGPPRFFALAITPTGAELAGTCGRGSARSDDGSWLPVEGPGNGVVHDFAVAPDGTLLATTGGSGLHRSFDDGRTWQPAGLDGLILYGMCAGAELLVGTEGKGVLGSRDGGETWSAVGGPPTAYRVLRVGEQRVLAGSENRGVWLHEGDGWRPVGADGFSVYALADLGDGTVLAGTRGDGLHRSGDGGETWAPTTAPDSVVHTLVVGDGSVWAGTGRGVHCSSDGGETWVAMGDDLANRRIFSVAVAAGAVLAGSYDGVWRWAEGAWQAVDTGLSPAETFTIAVGPSGRVLAGTRSAVLASDDAGRTFQEAADVGGAAHAFCWTSAGELLVGTDGGVRPEGLDGKWVFSLLEVEKGRVLAATLGHGVFARAGRWVDSSYGLTNPLVYQLVRTSGGVLAATGVLVEGAKSGRIFRSSDGGRTWAPTDHVPITVYRIVEDRAGRLFAGAQRCHVLRSLDGGDTWDVRQVDDVDDLKMYCLAVDGEDRLYLAAGALLLRSDDGAETWHEVGDGLDGLTTYDLVEHPDGALLAATSAGVFRSEDHGASWTSATFA